MRNKACGMRISEFGMIRELIAAEKGDQER